ncbi:IST1-like protein, partial [Tanacetum coccineum]
MHTEPQPHGIEERIVMSIDDKYGCRGHEGFSVSPFQRRGELPKITGIQREVICTPLFSIRTYLSKSNIELTLTRIEMIKRRRKAMVKYLRSDIAELMRIGLDSNAYGRVGRLYLDQKGSFCYDFVEQFCTLILNHLIAMNDQTECPEECKEAVSSLMYAAARFADLPELRELRSLFTERYGNSLESFVNKEPDSPTKDMKIQLMQEIALEHRVEWDPNSLDQKVHKPPSFAQV